MLHWAGLRGAATGNGEDQPYSAWRAAAITVTGLVWAGLGWSGLVWGDVRRLGSLLLGWAGVQQRAVARITITGLGWAVATAGGEDPPYWAGLRPRATATMNMLAWAGLGSDSGRLRRSLFLCGLGCHVSTAKAEYHRAGLAVKLRTPENPCLGTLNSNRNKIETSVVTIQSDFWEGPSGSCVLAKLTGERCT